MEGNSEITIFVDVGVHRLHRSVDRVIFARIRQIVCCVQHRELTLGHTHLLTDIVDGVREDDCLRIIDILRCEVHHATYDISRILTPCKHPADPVYRSIAIAISERLVHRRDEIVVLFTILVIVERLTACLEDRLACELPTSLEYTCCLEEIQRVAEIAVSEFGDEGKDRRCEYNIRIPFLYSAHVFLHESYDIRLADRFEDIGTTSREEGIDNSKTRILSRGTNQRHDTLLNPWEEHILLRLGPTMDLIEEEDRLTTILVVLLCPGDDLHDIFLFRENS